MWIIPNNLHTSHSAQDTEASTLDLKELSEILSQSVMWKSKPSQSSTWLKRLKQVSWILHLSGRILRPSLGQTFVTEWTSSQEASLVSHLVQPVEEVETKTLDTSGPILSEASKNLIDLPLFSWKTLKASSRQNSEVINGQTQRAHLFCFMSLENWRDWVTKRRQEYSQRVKSELLTRESACLSWHAAPILASQGELLFQQCLEPQAGKGQPWISPAAQAGKAQEKLYNKDGEPWVGQGRAYRENGMHRTLTLPLQIQHTQHQEVRSSTHGNHQELTKLNPRWVETLMGLPVGWTMPSCANPWTIEQMSSGCLEMESCQPL